MPNYPVGFYVYRLLDPKSDLPFYVGKGQRRRAWSHEAAVRSGNMTGNARKVAKIREILDRGEAVKVEIVAVYDFETEALDHEFRLVDASPTLTNIAPGGGGGIVSPEAAARRAEARRLLIERARKRDRQFALERETERRREKHLSAARSPRERAQITAWLDSLDAQTAKRVLTPVISARSDREAAAQLANRVRPRGRKARLLQGMKDTQDAIGRS